MKSKVRLLGKEVKVGTRVRTAYHYGKVSSISQKDNMFGIELTHGTSYSVNLDGYVHGYREPDYNRDVIEVLEETPIPRMSDECADTSTELELKNYHLTLENELLAQEVQELRQQLDEKKNHCKDVVEANLKLVETMRVMQGDLCKLSNDLYEAKANAAYYKRILTGLPASSSLTGGE